MVPQTKERQAATGTDDPVVSPPRGINIQLPRRATFKTRILKRLCIYREVPVTLDICNDMT